MTRTEKQAVIAAVILLAASCWMHFFTGLLGDRIWLLLAAKMWLGGQVLYVDIFEVNPPLVIWFYSIPEWLSQHLSFLQDYEALGAMGLLFCALSAFLGMRLIVLHPAFADPKSQRLFGLFLACLFIFFTRPVYFFDRDHIFFVLTFPYMLRFMPSLARLTPGFGLRLTIGLLAALGFCIKPHAILLFAVLQSLYVLRERRLAILWSLENLLVYAAALLYLACIRQFAPDYIRTVLPMAVATYSAFSRRIMGVFYCIIALIQAAVLFADFRRDLASPYRRDIYYFLGAGAGYLLYALAGNGWGYTYHPLMCQVLFLAFWMFKEYGYLKREKTARGQDAKRLVFGQRACGLVLLGNTGFLAYCVALYFLAPSVCDWAADCRKTLPFAKYIEEHHAHSFGALSEDFHRWPWLARLTGAAFDTRYNALWMLPKLAPGRNNIPEDHRWIVTSVGRGLADDFNRKKPDIVFVDDSKSFFGYPFHFDIPAFFEGVPEFAQAWSHYRLEGDMDDCKGLESKGDAYLTGCRYLIYRRVP